MEMPDYTQKEERLHVLTHGFGLVISFIGLGLLIQQASNYDDIIMLFSFIIFGASLILCFLSSVLYHAVQDLELKKKLRLLDHFAIYCLIGGSYTPFLLNNMPKEWSVYIFFGIWAIAIFGIVFKYFIRNKLQSYERIDAGIYAVMGLLSLLLLKPIFTYIPLEGIGLLIIGGLFYLIGIYYFISHKISFNHVIWHLFVILGAIAHYCAVYFYSFPLEG